MPHRRPSPPPLSSPFTPRHHPSLHDIPPRCLPSSSLPSTPLLAPFHSLTHFLPVIHLHSFHLLSPSLISPLSLPIIHLRFAVAHRHRQHSLTLTRPSSHSSPLFSPHSSHILLCPTRPTLHHRYHSTPAAARHPPLPHPTYHRFLFPFPFAIASLQLFPIFSIVPFPRNAFSAPVRPIPFIYHYLALTSTVKCAEIVGQAFVSISVCLRVRSSRCPLSSLVLLLIHIINLVPVGFLLFLPM
ncbi:hypothetical protein DENSPDRAFT_584669 [Dentipellis sp. KUC8613]|nr:hypothetical protein DENSPDRAFT_584669 [Dentipellis sp. KUC8613]